MLRSVSTRLISRIYGVGRVWGFGGMSRGRWLGMGGPSSSSMTGSCFIHSSGLRYAESHEDIDRSLLRWDQEIRKTGRIARQEIDELLQDIRGMKKATSNQVLMILRCCGDLVPSETPENRTKLVQEVWKTMENLNVPIDISHYNALLRVYFENEHKFNPTDILQELANKGIEANRVTYQRLIARYCQDGDIEGASTILQHMKEKQLPINEHVFNALINGHAMADDMESAEGMINVMKQAGLEPNDDTYVTLMGGYALKGNLENIRKIVKECEEKDVHLIDKDFMNVIYILAANGHDHLVEEVIPMFRKHAGFNQDATNLVLRLTNMGKLDIALRILKEMPRIVRNDEALPSGNFFITQLVYRSSVEEIVKYCKIMMDEGLNKYALSKACDIALQTRHFDKASELLEAYKESGAPIRQHYFWPFFAASRSEQDVYSGLKCMRYLEVAPASETLRDYVIPALFRHSKGSSAEKILEKLSSYTGISLAVLVPAAMQHLLSEKNVEQATSFAAKYRLNFTNAMLRKAVVDAYRENRNVKSFVQIIGSATLDSDEKAREVAGHMIMEVLERSRNKASDITPILTEMLNYGVGLSNSGAELIQNELGDGLTPELTNLIVQLTAADLTPRAQLYPLDKRTQQGTYEEMPFSELEQMYEDALKGGKPSRSLRKALLFGYCRRKNLDKAEAIRKDLASEGFVFPTGLQALLLELYAQANKLEEARDMYNVLKSGMDFPLDDLKILHYAGLLASNGLYEECMDVLRNTPRDENRKPTGGMQQAAAWRILNAAAEKGDVDNTVKLFDSLVQRNLCQINTVTLGPSVKAHLMKDDLENALKQFELCVNQYHATPWKQELFCRFIKSEDTDRLQIVIDLSTKLHGEVNTMYDLVFAFIECGKLRQAKKILETPGLRPRNDKIELTCQKYLEENRVGDLENLIQITKDVAQLDRSTMYFYLLQAYSKSNDVDKALSVWTSLQEENIQPSEDLLIYLADFLRKNNRTTPFVVPEVREESSTVAKQPSTDPAPEMTGSPLIRSFRRCLESNSIDEALQLKHRIEGNGRTEKLTFQDISLLIDKLSRAERLREAIRLTEGLLDSGQYPHPRVMRFLAGRLAAAGQVDALKHLESKLTPDLQRQVMLRTRLCVAYTNAGRGKEYFEKYIKNSIDNLGAEEGPASDADVSLAGSTYILVRHEDLLPEYEELAKRAEQKGSQGLYISLWNYYLVKKNFDKARELWRGKLSKADRIVFRTVMVESKIKGDDEIAKELAQQVMNSEAVSSPTKGSASSCVTDVLLAKGNVEEALGYLHTTLEKIKLEDFPQSSLIRLKDAVEATGKRFPYTVPKYERNRRVQTNEAADGE